MSQREAATDPGGPSSCSFLSFQLDAKAYYRYGSKTDHLFSARMCPFASCGHAAAWRSAAMGQNPTNAPQQAPP
jgi:hypothetical protein